MSNGSILISTNSVFVLIKRVIRKEKIWFWNKFRITRTAEGEKNLRKTIFYWLCTKLTKKKVRTGNKLQITKN
jgi:hypothetical protein